MITVDYSKMEGRVAADILILKFGKYKGTSMLDVPVDYLVWLQSEKLSQGVKTSDPFMQAIEFSIRNSRTR